MITRRTLLRAAGAGAASLTAPGWLPLRGQSTKARIDVMLDEPIGTIAPEIYGHFVEHLGAVVYDGI
ncbi:MAG TPA: alpha-L-arabinofuranosidase, partial [Solibacterales bacterium]|nr:alpha-L-arabinofuranosidase [Bryobacterales bacterium]